MLTFTNDVIRDKLKAEYPHASSEIDSIDFGPFPQLEESVKSDVQFLKDHPLVLKESKITGWVYEVETGKVNLIYKYAVLKLKSLLYQVRQVV